MVNTVSGILRSCTGKVRRWPVPPNWTMAEWMLEVSAIAEAAAFEAGSQFDPERGSEVSMFLTSRVMGRVLTRYRQEWCFATRFAMWTDESQEPPPEYSSRDRDENLRDAVDRLPEADRWLVLQMFWQDRDQNDLANELGISQPAISKRYKKIVRHLRCSLSIIETSI